MLGSPHVILVSLLVLLGLPARARPAPELSSHPVEEPGSPIDRAAGTGAISGAVTDAATTNPIQGVAMNVYDSNGAFAEFAFTDAAGSYTASGLAAGTYYVRAVHDDYLDEVYDDVPCFPTCIATSGTPVVVAEGGTTTGIDFALDLGGTITGTITASAGGSPIAGANVLIYDASGSGVTGASADSSGQYATPGLPSGTYYAVAHNLSPYVDELYDDITCTVCTVTDGTPIAVTQGSATAGIDFALDLGGQIAGTVTDAVDGSPIQGAFIFVYDLGGAFVTAAFTDSSGAYLTYGVPAGSYLARTSFVDVYIDELYDDLPCDPTCSVTDGTPIVVGAGATTNGIDFPLSGPLRFWKADALEPGAPRDPPG